MSLDEKVKVFQKAFAGFGNDEFQLANDDLYPDWKKGASPNGTWAEFLGVYRDFVQWWLDQGCPARPEQSFGRISWLCAKAIDSSGFDSRLCFYRGENHPARCGL